MTGHDGMVLKGKGCTFRQIAWNSCWILLSLLVFASNAKAVTCVVPGTSHATIQAGIDDVACDIIDVAAGIYSAPVVVNRDLRIQGAGHDSGMSYTAIQSTIVINNDAILELSRLAVELIDGNGILLDSKFAELRGDNFRVSQNTDYGIDFGPSASDAIVDISNCLIDENNGGINARELVMDNCVVQQNSPNGGATVGLKATISNSEFLVNENYGDGGGLLLDHNAGIQSRVQDSGFYFNRAIGADPSVNLSDGGAIMVRQGRLDLYRSVLKENSAGRFGGGISSNSQFGSRIRIFDSTIAVNIAYDSGGGVAAIQPIEITGTRIIDNQVIHDGDINANGLAAGGGIFSQDNLTMLDTLVEGNSATSKSGSGNLGNGGGIYLSIINAGRSASVERSTFSGNHAERNGGGIHVNGGEVNVLNSTLWANQADLHGGGLYANSTDVAVKNSTIAGNRADAANTTGTGDGNGGGIYGPVRLTLTAVGGNMDLSGTPNYQPDCSGSVISDGFSAIGVNNGCAATWDSGPGNLSGSTPSPLDLGLLSLAWNGGDTPTIALGLGSPLLDAGTQVCAGKDTDQRGSTRIKQDGNNDGGFDNDPCDIGAFETLKNHCSVAVPITLTEFTYTDRQDVKSKALISTVGNVAIAGSGGDLLLVSSSGISIGPGFRVNDSGLFQAGIREVSCL